MKCMCPTRLAHISGDCAYLCDYQNNSIHVFNVKNKTCCLLLSSKKKYAN